MSKIKITFKSEIIIDTNKYGYDITFDEFTKVYKESNKDSNHAISIYHEINDNIKCVKMEHIDD